MNVFHMFIPVQQACWPNCLPYNHSMNIINSERAQQEVLNGLFLTQIRQMPRNAILYSSWSNMLLFKQKISMITVVVILDKYLNKNDIFMYTFQNKNLNILIHFQIIKSNRWKQCDLK